MIHSDILTLLPILVCALLLTACGSDTEGSDQDLTSADTVRQDSAETTKGAPVSRSAPRPEMYPDSVRSAARTLTDLDRRIEQGDSVSCDALLSALPFTFRAFSDLYGYEDLSYAEQLPEDVSPRAPLYLRYQEQWSTFTSHRDCFDQPRFVQRLIEISAGGRWAADSVGFFKVFVQQKLRKQTPMFCDRLRASSSGVQTGFWYFFLSGPHPGPKSTNSARDIVQEDCPAQIAAIQRAAEQHAGEAPPSPGAS